MLNGHKGSNGCQTQLHETISIYGVPSKAKEQKIIDRIIAHQLIILENPSSQLIENIRLRNGVQSSKAQDQPAATATATTTNGNGNQNATPGIVRPSSLNYKISLSEAVVAFCNKDKLNEDQYTEIEGEEPAGKKTNNNFEIMDDIMFNFQAPAAPPKPTSQQALQKKRESNNAINARGVQSQWEKEEEMLRRKLEKNSINQMKSKIAQQNKANQEQS